MATNATNRKTQYVVDLVYDRHQAGTPVVVILAQHMSQPYSERLSARAISPDTGYPDYLLAMPGTTNNNRRQTVCGVGRLTGRRRAATATQPPMVEVEFAADYTGNSTEEARKLVAAMS